MAFAFFGLVWYVHGEKSERGAERKLARGVEEGRRGFGSFEGVLGAGTLNGEIWRTKSLFRVGVISVASMKF